MSVGSIPSAEIFSLACQEDDSRSDGFSAFSDSKWGVESGTEEPVPTERVDEAGTVIYEQCPARPLDAFVIHEYPSQPSEDTVERNWKMFLRTIRRVDSDDEAEIPSVIDDIFPESVVQVTRSVLSASHTALAASITFIETAQRTAQKVTGIATHIDQHNQLRHRTESLASSVYASSILIGRELITKAHEALNTSSASQKTEAVETDEKGASLVEDDGDPNG